MIYRGPGDRRHTGRLRKRDNLLTGEGAKGVGEEPNHTTAKKPKKPGASINHLRLSAMTIKRGRQKIAPPLTSLNGTCP
jgi:hypothetical protein